jgi:PKD repeat protein
VIYTWDFGDGESGSGAAASRLYDAPGDYTVLVTATNSVSDLPAETTVLVEETVAGLAVESDGPTALGQTTMFTATITAGTNVIYSWDFGDGESGSGAVASHLYDAPGDYTVLVTATNSVSDLPAEITVLVEETIAGLAAENNGPTALGQPTMFTASVTAGTNVVYSWDFGDGESGSGAVASHLYDAPGDYIVSVTATNALGPVLVETIVEVYVLVFLPMMLYH